MVPICYKNVKKNLYEIDEYGNIYSHYKKDFLIPATETKQQIENKLGYKINIIS